MASTPSSQDVQRSPSHSPQHPGGSPTSEVRNRRSLFSSDSIPLMTGAFPDSHSSARSPASSSSTIYSSPIAVPRLADPPSRTPPRGPSAPLRKPIIKVDYSIATTFDPVDVDLYALWAPAR